MSLFTPQVNNTIKELIEVLEHLPNFCEKICEKVNEQYATNFTLNQVHQYLKDELQVKIPQNRGEPFTEQIDNSIKEFMKKFGQSSNPYVKVSENINKLYSTNYTSKQIRQRWISKLNIDLCLEPLSEDEKSFIVQWVESKPQGDTICWKELILLMETKFKKLRSESMVKNFWYLRKRTQEISKSKSETENSRKRKGSPNGDSNAILMDTSPKSEENIIHLPPLNARPMETSFKSEERIHLPPLNARPLMETSFKSEERIHLPPLNAKPMDIPPKSEENIIHLPLLNARQLETSFKSEERIHLPPLNARPMEISFENEENTPPLNRMEILCWAADEAYKRDYPTK
ncbi:unnamed protein product [Rhizophagus irregularis]|uniref:Myb-like domain-containing protein n=1 Tax=Rhizophagus irregularis TaxID=588596 RepID=A0A2N1MS41_9GLOM|nr:hypothetical protein RhiirC2_810895 [Rhizophagus irregularis]CAB4381907.1 unnamed protein product [Rhizophagus irregularis]CAB5352810.1 unnamed protein product [Rhizophagus irregularis]